MTVQPDETRRLAADLPPLLLGCDFTSRPTARKPVVLAWGQFDGKKCQYPSKNGALSLLKIQLLDSFPAVAGALQAPSAAWLGGFDLPFGLPRELVQALGWPTDWHACMQHYRHLSREQHLEVETRLGHAMEAWREGAAEAGALARLDRQGRSAQAWREARSGDGFLTALPPLAIQTLPSRNDSVISMNVSARRAICARNSGSTDSGAARETPRIGSCSEGPFARFCSKAASNALTTSPI